jgi:hypothetical protein
MGALLVVVDDPSIEIGLQLVDCAVDLLAERHAVELVEHGAVEALADAVVLRAFRFGAAVVDILDRQVELVFMALAAAELGAAVGQYPRQPDAVLIIERQHPVVEDFGRGDRRLAVVELGKGDLGVGAIKVCWYGFMSQSQDPLPIRADCNGAG